MQNLPVAVRDSGERTGMSLRPKEKGLPRRSLAAQLSLCTPLCRIHADAGIHTSRLVADGDLDKSKAFASELPGRFACLAQKKAD
jgi:hypothetical protein